MVLRTSFSFSVAITKKKYLQFKLFQIGLNWFNQAGETTVYGGTYLVSRSIPSCVAGVGGNASPRHLEYKVYTL